MCGVSCRVQGFSSFYGRLFVHQLPVPRGDELFRGRFPGRLKVRAQAPHSPHKAPVCATRRPHRARLWRSLDSGKRFSGKRFVVSFPQAQGGPGAARRAREAKRSVQRCGRNAPSPRALRPRRAAREEWSASYLPCLRVGRLATADSAIPTRPTPCPRISAVGARCGSASLEGGWARGAPGRQLAPAAGARGRFLTSCLGAGERPLPRATRPLDAVGPLLQDERGRSERGARRRAKGRERSDTTRHERSDTTRHEFFRFY